MENNGEGANIIRRPTKQIIRVETKANNTSEIFDYGNRNSNPEVTIKNHHTHYINPLTNP